jgi:hypothetical protein
MRCSPSFPSLLAFALAAGLASGSLAMDKKGPPPSAHLLEFCRLAQTVANPEEIDKAAFKKLKPILQKEYPDAAKREQFWAELKHHDCAKGDGARLFFAAFFAYPNELDPAHARMKEFEKEKEEEAKEAAAAKAPKKVAGPAPVCNGEASTAPVLDCAALKAAHPKLATLAADCTMTKDGHHYFFVGFHGAAEKHKASIVAAIKPMSLDQRTWGDGSHGVYGPGFYTTTNYDGAKAYGLASVNQAGGKRACFIGFVFSDAKPADGLEVTWEEFDQLAESHKLACSGRAEDSRLKKKINYLSAGSEVKYNDHYLGHLKVVETDDLKSCD